MKYQINVELSEDGIQHLQNVLTQYKKLLPVVSQKFIQYSLDYLQDLAQKNIDLTVGGSQWYQITNNLKHSFTKVYSNFYGELINNALYACYVEFGTGEFASLGDGRQGGWFFKDNKGILRFTHGTRPHLFMKNAFNSYYVAKKYEEIWDRAFDEVMKGVLK